MVLSAANMSGLSQTPPTRGRGRARIRPRDNDVIRPGRVTRDNVTTATVPIKLSSSATPGKCPVSPNTNPNAMSTTPGNHRLENLNSSMCRDFDYGSPGSQRDFLLRIEPFPPPIGSQCSSPSSIVSQDSSRSFNGARDSFRSANKSQANFRTRNGSQDSFCSTSSTESQDSSRSSNESDDSFRSSNGSDDSFHSSNESQDSFRSSNGSQDSFRSSNGSQDSFRSSNESRDSFRSTNRPKDSFRSRNISQNKSLLLSESCKSSPFFGDTSSSDSEDSLSLTSPMIISEAETDDKSDADDRRSSSDSTEVFEKETACSQIRTSENPIVAKTETVRFSIPVPSPLSSPVLSSIPSPLSSPNSSPTSSPMSSPISSPAASPIPSPFSSPILSPVSSSYGPVASQEVANITSVSGAARGVVVATPLRGRGRPGGRGLRKDDTSIRPGQNSPGSSPNSTGKALSSPTGSGVGVLNSSAGSSCVGPNSTAKCRCDKDCPYCVGEERTTPGQQNNDGQPRRSKKASKALYVPPFRTAVMPPSRRRPDVSSKCDVTANARIAAVAPIVSKCDITPNVSKSDVTPNVRKSGVIHNVSKSDVITNARCDVAPNVNKPAVTPITNVNKSGVTPVRKGDVSINASKSDVTPNVSKSDVITNSRCDIAPNVSKADVTPNVSKSDVIPNVSKSGVTPVRKGDVTPSASKSDVTPDVSSSDVITNGSCDVAPNISKPAITPNVNRSGAAPKSSKSDVPLNVSRSGVNPVIKRDIAANVRTAAVNPVSKSDVKSLCSRSNNICHVNVTPYTRNASDVNRGDVTPETKRGDVSNPDGESSGRKLRRKRPDRAVYQPPFRKRGFVASPSSKKSNVSCVSDQPEDIPVNVQPDVIFFYDSKSDVNCVTNQSDVRCGGNTSVFVNCDVNESGVMCDDKLSDVIVDNNQPNVICDNLHSDVVSSSSQCDVISVNSQSDVISSSSVSHSDDSLLPDVIVDVQTIDISTNNINPDVIQTVSKCDVSGSDYDVSSSDCDVNGSECDVTSTSKQTEEEQDDFELFIDSYVPQVLDWAAYMSALEEE